MNDNPWIYRIVQGITFRSNGSRIALSSTNKTPDNGHLTIDTWVSFDSSCRLVMLYAYIVVVSQRLAELLPWTSCQIEKRLFRCYSKARQSVLLPQTTMVQRARQKWPNKLQPLSAFLSNRNGSHHAWRPLVSLSVSALCLNIQLPRRKHILMGAMGFRWPKTTLKCTKMF